MPAVVLTILTATKSKKGKLQGRREMFAGFLLHSGHCPGCFTNVTWHISHTLSGNYCDPHFAAKETEAWRGWALPAPSPQSGTRRQGRELSTGLAVFQPAHQAVLPPPQEVMIPPRVQSQASLRRYVQEKELRSHLIFACAFIDQSRRLQEVRTNKHTCCSVTPKFH